MSFKFSDKNMLELEVCGKTYMVDPYSQPVMDGMLAYHAKVSSLGEEENAGHENILQVCEAVGEMVEAVLGKGAYAEVFSGREVNFLDHQELAMHLTAELLTFRKKRLSDFTAHGVERSRKVLQGE